MCYYMHNAVKQSDKLIAMANKLHIICAKCGSTLINIKIPKVCADDPLNVVYFSCENCKELTGIYEWAETNNRKVVDDR
ncbi:hypothetical protein MIJ3_00328 [Pseudomonas phage vB_PaeM_MIJ3]|nr:hypothetical protein GBBBJNDB_00331 [Pseudomonas phage Callisto]VOH55644.1 hypothetical protein MIJ3_00328 [Pseudomonas phage vB_PaeM_MIJ3]